MEAAKGEVMKATAKRGMVPQAAMAAVWSGGWEAAR